MPPKTQTITASGLALRRAGAQRQRGPLGVYSPPRGPPARQGGPRPLRLRWPPRSAYPLDRLPTSNPTARRAVTPKASRLVAARSDGVLRPLHQTQTP